MKRCPTCQKTYTDRNLSYCIDDGSPLVPIAEDDDPTVVSRKQSTQPDQNDWNAAAYRPPSAYIPPTTTKRRVWPWVVGLLSLLVLIVVGLGIAAVVFAPSIIRRAAESNRNVGNTANRNTNPPPPATPNTNSQPNVNANTNAAANTNTTPAPTDKEQVLAQLTDLENEWTVANINADKKKLDLILADDYVGPAVNGQLQGKRDYLRTIQRDRTIEKWEFKELKVTLRGDRATLAGKIYINRSGANEVYDFVDKFVWRDGRWQATGSVVTRA